MDDAKLHLRLREGGFYRFGKTLESIHAGDEDVFDSTLRLRRDS